MRNYKITLANNSTISISADMHYTDGISHLFYTFADGLICSCDIESQVEEV